MADQRERPLHELLSRDMVDIYVGSDNTHWILHEKLLCHRSTFFRNIFYTKSEHRNRAFGLPDEDDEPFRLFVGWLYSAAVPVPTEEKDLGNLFDLYLMGEKWAIKDLIVDVLDSVRRFYNDTQTYPGLRRIQYVYAETKEDSPMRQFLVSAVARDLVLREGMPAHWDKALRKNGQLAVDLILAVQKWKVDPEQVADPRVESVEPVVEEAAQKGAIKAEEVTEEKLSNGINGVHEIDNEEKLTNGVNGVHLNDGDDANEDDAE